MFQLTNVVFVYSWHIPTRVRQT